MSALWSDDRPPRPLTARRHVTELAALAVMLAALLFAFLAGQSRQDRWCTAHPTAAQTAQACPNPTPGGTR